MEKTFSMIKPDAVARNLIGHINAKIESVGFKILAMKTIHLSHHQASSFYEVHKERSFFTELVETMTSGMVVVQVLQRKDAVSIYREIMGATNPKEALAGTIRADFGISISQNSIHGSDSLENAKREISFFFSESDLCTPPLNVELS